MDQWKIECLTRLTRDIPRPNAGAGSWGWRSSRQTPRKPQDWKGKKRNHFCQAYQCSKTQKESEVSNGPDPQADRAMIIEATHSANTAVPTHDTDRSREQDDHAIRQAALAFARAHVKGRGPPISLDSTQPSPPTPAAFWFRPLVHPDAKQPLPLTTFSVGQREGLRRFFLNPEKSLVNGKAPCTGQHK